MSALVSLGDSIWARVTALYATVKEKGESLYRKAHFLLATGAAFDDPLQMDLPE